MCKVLIIAGIDDKHRDNAIKFTKRMATLMTLGNDDGLGYAAVDKEGNLFAQRWLKNEHRFLSPVSKSTTIDKLKFFCKNPTKTSIEYTEHGMPDLNKMTAITLHTRAATTEVCMKNVHPFIDDDSSVIHNGVIINDDEFKLKLSTCDSESILISYLRNNINTNIGNMDAMAKELIGYYACGTFSRDKNNNRILDIFKANNYNLAVGWIDELNTWVISTSDFNMKEACKDLGFTGYNWSDLNDGFLIRVNPNTGELLDSKAFAVSNRTKPYVTPAATNNYTRPAKNMSLDLPKTFDNNVIDFLKHKSKIIKFTYQEKLAYLSNQPTGV